MVAGNRKCFFLLALVPPALVRPHLIACLIRVQRHSIPFGTVSPIQGATPSVLRWLEISPDETIIAAYVQIAPKSTEVPEEPIRFIFSPRAAIAIGETGFRLRLGCVTRRAWIGRVRIRNHGIVRRGCKVSVCFCVA